jgi:hypothetical protein
LKFVTVIEKVSLTVTEKTKSLKLPERLRNLNTTYSDVERMGKLPEKMKSYDDDHVEHSRGGGDWHGMSMQRMTNIACTICTKAIYTRYKEEKGCCSCWSMLWLLLLKVIHV